MIFGRYLNHLREKKLSTLQNKKFYVDLSAWLDMRGKGAATKFFQSTSLESYISRASFINRYREKYLLLFISLIRMRSKRDIKMGRLCTPGGAVLGIVGGGVTFRFFNW